LNEKSEMKHFIDYYLIFNITSVFRKLNNFLIFPTGWTLKKKKMKAKAEITRLVSLWGGWQALLSSLASVTAIGWLINKLISSHYQKHNMKKLQDKVPTVLILYPNISTETMHP
jgi:hypothetical protein